MLGWSSSPTSRARLASVVRPRYRSSRAASRAMAPLLIFATLGLQIATLVVTVAISNSNWRHRGRRGKGVSHEHTEYEPRADRGDHRRITGPADLRGRRLRRVGTVAARPG